MLPPDPRQHASKVIEEPKSRSGWYFLIAIVAGVAVWAMQQQPIWEPPAKEGSSGSESSANLRSTARGTINRDQGAHSAKGDLRTLFSADDYPASALQAGDQGTVQVQLAVDATGKVISCVVLRSSGHSSLDNATCGILRRRARFVPARDVNGQAVPDRVTTPPVTWRLEG